MKAHIWEQESALRSRRPAQPKRKTVAQILRAAYHKHVRDPHTRQAVKRCLH